MVLKNASSIYPALKAPILIRNDSLTLRSAKQNSFVNILHVECVMSILVGYGKTLTCKGLTVI